MKGGIVFPSGMKSGQMMVIVNNLIILYTISGEKVEEDWFELEKKEYDEMKKIINEYGRHIHSFRITDSAFKKVPPTTLDLDGQDDKIRRLFKKQLELLLPELVKSYSNDDDHRFKKIFIDNIPSDPNYDPHRYALISQPSRVEC
ncbi:unnamed protein product [Caenorhabditis nigoni]